MPMPLNRAVGSEQYHSQQTYTLHQNLKWAAASFEPGSAVYEMIPLTTELTLQPPKSR